MELEELLAGDTAGWVMQDLVGCQACFQHTFNAIAAPEPSTAALAGAGLIALAMARRRRAR